MVSENDASRPYLYASRFALHTPMPALFGPQPRHLEIRVQSCRCRKGALLWIEVRFECESESATWLCDLSI